MRSPRRLWLRVAEVGVPLAAAAVFYGVFIARSLAAIPGLGSLLINSISTRDYAIIQLVTLVLALFVVVANLLTDIAYVVFDPRVELQSA